MSLQAWQFLPDVSKRLYDSNILLHARGFALRVCITNFRSLNHICTKLAFLASGQSEAQNMADLLSRHALRAHLRTVTT